MRKKPPNILRNVLPSKTVQPINMVKCRKVIYGYLTFRWRVFCGRALLAVHPQVSFLLQGWRLNFPASLAAICDHVTALGQWNVSGCAGLYNVILGPQNLPCPWSVWWRAIGGRSLDPPITSRRRAAHSSGTPILSHQVRQHNLELC